ncbi:hypothetical protein [Hydrogenovibrio marinus]|uniref:Restriction endonuclease type IV Mrr domain-containing protein n=1 Tax=Hydrogenovibrio marinus TaxID=28885 RepID=A0A066ZR58_HYDMR|nr:hypothetical protein [Hydrogenovibrio marinus]KDN96278.1 hypothetical protein EI16_08350 [Hydrogenovibrio marinus]BBN60538.1 hypothetical protein HVMH_2132 [Hydrogenovibrio marinus]
MTDETNSFQRIGSESNSKVGKNFELNAQKFFKSIGIHLALNLKVPVGVTSEKKDHAFDLGNEQEKIIVECKSHKWTTGGNVPSAKLTVWNEAMYYFLVAPDNFRKIMFVLKDTNEKTTETLAEYYFRRYSHLIPSNVEFWEYNESLDYAQRIR